MGVDRSDYIVIGANIGMEHYNDDWWEMDINPADQYDGRDKPGEITWIIDGMSGNYFVVGEVIQCDPEGYNGFNQVEIDLHGTTETKFLQASLRVREHIRDNFGIDVIPKLIVLTHWH